MYIIYLASAIALSTGIGAFVQYDTLSKQRDFSDRQIAAVQNDQRDVITRSLRRQYQINPSVFPNVPPGEYRRIDNSLLQASLTTGIIDLEASAFYVGSEGQIVAVSLEGPLSPASGNGDFLTGYSGQPQYASGLFQTILDGNVARITAARPEIARHQQTVTANPEDQVERVTGQVDDITEATQGLLQTGIQGGIGLVDDTLSLTGRL